MQLKTWRAALTDAIVLVSFFDILFLVLPGTSILVYYHNALFLSLDWIKLILLSAAITTPIVLINTVCASALFDNDVSRDELLVFLTTGIIVSALILYATIAVSYFTGQSESHVIEFVVGIETVLILMAAVKTHRFAKSQS